MLTKDTLYCVVAPLQYHVALSFARGYYRVYGGGSTAYTVDGDNGVLVVPFIADDQDEVVEDPDTYPLVPVERLVVQGQHAVPSSVVDKYVVEAPVKKLSIVKPFIDGLLMLYGYRLKSMIPPAPVVLRSMGLEVPKDLSPGKAVVFMLYMYKRLIDLSPEQPLNHFLRHAYKIQYMVAEYLRSGKTWRHYRRYVDWKYVADSLILHRVFDLVTSHSLLADIYMYLNAGSEDMVVERLLPPQFFTVTISYPSLMVVERDRDGNLVVLRLEDSVEAQAMIARYQLAKKLMVLTPDSVKTLLIRAGVSL